MLRSQFNPQNAYTGHDFRFIKFFDDLLALFVFIVRCEFREMGTPEARNLISVRCGFTTYIYIFVLGGGDK